MVDQYNRMIVYWFDSVHSDIRILVPILVLKETYRWLVLPERKCFSYRRVSDFFRFSFFPISTNLLFNHFYCNNKYELGHWHYCAFLSPFLLQFSSDISIVIRFTTRSLSRSIFPSLEFLCQHWRCCIVVRPRSFSQGPIIDMFLINYDLFIQ